MSKYIARSMLEGKVSVGHEAGVTERGQGVEDREDSAARANLSMSLSRCVLSASSPNPV